jgi:hypothetical protein
MNLEKLREIFVEKELFNLRMQPLEKLVYGVVAMILLAFAGVVIKFFIK